MGKDEILEHLKWQRNELDDLIYRIGGKKHADTIINAETANNMVKAVFDDVANAINNGNIDLAYKWAREYRNKKWFEGI